jgi:hypothetical protein
MYELRKTICNDTGYQTHPYTSSLCTSVLSVMFRNQPVHAETTMSTSTVGCALYRRRIHGDYSASPNLYALSTVVRFFHYSAPIYVTNG